MTISKKIIVPEIKDNKEVVMDNLSNLKLDEMLKKKSGKSIIRISTYSYGSNGKLWYYLSKLNKKQ